MLGPTAVAGATTGAAAMPPPPAGAWPDGGGHAFTCRDHRKSVPCFVKLWQFMHPARMFVWSNVSSVVLADAEVAPNPGKVLPGVAGVCGLFATVGH